MSDNPETGAGAASIKPYLVRAIYQWAVDNDLTPQLLVDAGVNGVAVPAEQVRHGRVVLSIHPSAVRGLELGERELLFSARFGGRAFEVCVPVAAVLAVFCRENGRGIVFDAGDAGDAPPADSDSDSEQQTGAKKPGQKQTPSAPLHLKLVK